MFPDSLGSTGGAQDSPGTGGTCSGTVPTGILPKIPKRALWTP